MTREEAINKVRQMSLPKEMMDILEALAPELAMSDDERIRESLIKFLTEIKDISESGRTSWAVRKEDAEMCKSFIDYLEKQKEQSITANDLDEEIHRFFDDCIEVHDAKIYGVDERVITVDCYEITARHFAKWGEKQKEHHLELKAGKWYICHRAFCARADHLTVKEGERFQCEKDGIVKGFVIKEPEKYFKECSAPEPMEKEQKPAEFTHHETNESLKDAVTHQMEDDGDIDDFVRKGIDDVVLKYAKLGAKWQKEHKPVDFPTTDEEVNEFLETHPKVEVPEKYKTPDFVFKKKEYESHPIISKDTTSVKSAEWSDEDADMLNCCISSIEEAKENRYAYKETDGDTSYDREIDWLKSLRPSWKTSEDEVRLINTSISFLKDFADKGYENAVECIDWLKSKLNGNTCK